MKKLTITELDKTLHAFLEAVKPLVDEKIFAQTQAVTTEFAEGVGEALNEALLLHAQATAGSWVFDIWREHCLLNHDSLPLSSNVGVKIEWQATQNGLKRLAFFTHCIAQVHRLYFLGQLEERLKQLNLPYSPEPWQILLGAGRRPDYPQDHYIFNPENAKGRHAIVLFKGKAWKMTLMDEKSRLANPAQIEKVLYQIQSSGHFEPDILFTAPSVLPTEEALEVRKQMISRADNGRIWQQIESALFVISIDNGHHNDDEDALHDISFGEGDGIWAYKPFNYRYHLQDNRLYVNVEHTWVDAHIIDEILMVAQEHYHQQAFARKNDLPEHLDVELLDWTIETNTRALIKEHLVDFQRRSEAMSVTIHDIFLSKSESQLLKQENSDAIIQLLLQYAQKVTYGSIRSTYQTIGTYHEHNGCGDNIRTVSEISVALVEEMLRNQSNESLFARYLEEHQQKLQRAELELSLDYHLQGLQAMAEAQGLEVAFFEDEGFKRLQKNFITTTSYAQQQMISHVAYAPSYDGGLAIDYSLQRSSITFVITHKRSELPNVTQFTQALQSGLKKLLRLFNEVENTHVPSYYRLD